MNNIIDGKLVSSHLRKEIAEEIVELKNQGINPGLAVILVGNNPASAVYVRNKERACLETGIKPAQISLSEKTTEEELITLIKKLNNDESIHGILVQLPLPDHISEKKVIETIAVSKDVDAFSHDSVGRIMTREYSFLPCTPAGIMELLKFYNIDINGKECVVVGRSNIVGKPMAMLLLNSNGTVTVCHSRTKNLKDVCKRADIIVCAVGKANFLKADMVKKGAVVIDVGINRTEEGKIVGDVDFPAVSEVASMITPVPGGVGPMTITMLLKNTLTAAKRLK